MANKYRPLLLERIAGYEAQFDPVASKLTVTLDGSTTTKLQRAQKVAVSTNLDESLKQNIAKSLSGETGIFITAPADLIRN